MSAHVSGFNLDPDSGVERRRRDDVYPENVPRHLQYPDIAAWELLDRAALSMPGRLACHYNESRWTWEELQIDACRAAKMLRRAGVRPGDRVGILLPNCPEYVIALNGIWRLGGIAVLLSPKEVAGEIERQRRATDCRVVICLDMLAGLLTGGFRPDLTMFVSLRPQLPLFEQLGYLYQRKRRTGNWWWPAENEIHWFWETPGELAGY